MEDFSKYDLERFTSELSSKASVPGGGGASAVVGALAVSLGSMVGSLTLGKKKYVDVEEDIRTLMESSEAHRKRLLSLVNEDARCFEPLSRAYSIPKDDPKREKVLEDALKTACTAPMDIMRESCSVIMLLEEYAKKGSQLAISDAGVGAVCAKAALSGAYLNVLINVELMKDKAYAKHLREEAQEMLEEYSKRADAVYETVYSKIVGQE